MDPHLTKTEFLIGRDCPAKLHYARHRFPSTADEDEYLTLLADGGYMVEELARLQCPGGVEMPQDTDRAAARTVTALAAPSAVLFQAAVLAEGLLARIDILEKDGGAFRIVEVKSKSYDSSVGPAILGKPDWRRYLEDTAFQKYVLSLAYPGAAIETYLLMPDIAKRCPVEGLIGMFRIGGREAGSRFTGDPELARRADILTRVPVDRLVDPLIPEIVPWIEKFIEAIRSDRRIEEPIGARCRGCEYTLTDGDHPESGFRGCWGYLADPEPHILSLAHLGNFNRRGEIDSLIAMGKTSLYDVPAALVAGKFDNRAYYQVTRSREVFLEPAAKLVREVEYPLYFLDFETSQMAVPYHAGMRPYRNVLFQWSCHVVDAPGAEPRHEEWIGDAGYCPNVRFGESLAELIGPTGTVMAWSPYEAAQLRYLAEFIRENDLHAPGLSDWIGTVLPRIFDMHELAKKYFYHPAMGGRTSIKVVLPAVLSAGGKVSIRRMLEGAGLYRVDDTGMIADPYSLLPKTELIGAADTVKDGTGAMRAYQDMIYGRGAEDPEVRDAYRAALLRYCMLDTLAMVIIWEYWRALASGGTDG